jgi:hypothetical protein
MSDSSDKPQTQPTERPTSLPRRLCAGAAFLLADLAAFALIASYMAYWPQAVLLWFTDRAIHGSVLWVPVGFVAALFFMMLMISVALTLGEAASDLVNKVWHER